MHKNVLLTPALFILGVRKKIILINYKPDKLNIILSCESPGKNDGRHVWQ